MFEYYIILRDIFIECGADPDRALLNRQRGDPEVERYIEYMESIIDGGVDMNQDWYSGYIKTMYDRKTHLTLKQIKRDILLDTLI